MNLLTAQTAIAGIIFVTFLWGSWFQTVKHLGKFPVHAFISIMYAISVVIVWLAIGILGNKMIPQGIFYELKKNPSLMLAVWGCGIVFGIAMQLHLTVVKRIGLILSTSVSATCSILGGTIVSVLFAGVPEGVSVPLLFFASFLLILATIICQYAGVCRDTDKYQQSQKDNHSRVSDILLLAFINLILMSSYPLANSIGIRSSLNPNGFSSLTCMGILVIGACIGSSLFTLILLQRNHGCYNKSDLSPHLLKLLALTLIAAICHFGGNVLHAVFAPVVSIAIATAIGNSYHCWSYLWGLVYGEFKGARKRTYGILFSGILLFIAGVILLSINSV